MLTCNHALALQSTYFNQDFFDVTPYMPKLASSMLNSFPK